MTTQDRRDLARIVESYGTLEIMKELVAWSMTQEIATTTIEPLLISSVHEACRDADIPEQEPPTTKKHEVTK